MAVLGLVAPASPREQRQGRGHTGRQAAPAALSQPCLAVQRRVAGRRIAKEVLYQRASLAGGGKRVALGQQVVWSAERFDMIPHTVTRKFKPPLRCAGAASKRFINFAVGMSGFAHLAGKRYFVFGPEAAWHFQSFLSSPKKATGRKALMV